MSSPVAAKMNRSTSIRIFAAALIAGVLSAAGAWAEAVRWPLSFSSDLKETGWRLHTPRGKPAAVFSVSEDKALTVSAQAAVSFLYRRVPKAARGATGLTWTWRVDRDVPPTDLSVPGEDDRPLAVHVYFDDTDAGLMQRFAGLFALPASGRALTYVWGSDLPPGTFLANPFMDQGKGVLVVVRPSRATTNRASEWETVRVNLADDYRRAFKRDPEPLRGLAISSDTDDTSTFAQGRIKSVFLTSD